MSMFHNGLNPLKHVQHFVAHTSNKKKKRKKKESKKYLVYKFMEHLQYFEKTLKIYESSNLTNYQHKLNASRN